MVRCDFGVLEGALIYLSGPLFIYLGHYLFIWAIIYLSGLLFTRKRRVAKRGFLSCDSEAAADGGWVSACLP